MKLYAIATLMGLSAWAGFHFGFEYGRQRAEHRRALEFQARPKITTTAFLLPCPALNRHGIEEWHRTCRARERNERIPTMKGK